jgi:hypothetical protein
MGIRKFFFGQADDQALRLSNAKSTEIKDMASLVTGAIEQNLKVAPRMPDDPGTGVSIAVLASLPARNPETAARMAWAVPDLG